MNAIALKTLGWKPCFEQQLTSDENKETTIVRVGAHFGSQVLCISADDEWRVPTSLIQSCGEVAVGDWLLLDPNTHRATRRLVRESLIARVAAGEKVTSQLIAANLNTLIIVSSCNRDFNLSRLERYLALAIEAKVTPVVVLTKADACDDPIPFRQKAAQLRSGLIVEAMDARDASQVRSLLPWCGVGQTVALVGSSGVGKSTLAMTLGAGELETQAIREDDARGRHTTTARSIHHLDAGGLLIDTPGMRELQLAGCEDGLAEVFDEIVELSRSCQFRDCTHQDEPGCAVQASIESGGLDSRRLTNYRKLQSEQARNTRSLREQRYDARKMGQFYKSVQSSKRRQREGNRDV